jgi:hypothetical protein
MSDVRIFEGEDPVTGASATHLELKAYGHHYTLVISPDGLTVKEMDYEKMCYVDAYNDMPGKEPVGIGGTKKSAQPDTPAKTVRSGIVDLHCPVCEHNLFRELASGTFECAGCFTSLTKTALALAESRK